MNRVEEMLAFNKKFVKNKLYKEYTTTKFPDKKIAVLSCMDTRLTELLPAALNFKNGDVKIIKNAGAVVTHPFGSVMRSLMIAVYQLGVEDILVIGHHDCGMQGMKASKIIQKMAGRNITKDRLNFVRSCGVDIEKWLEGFSCAADSVRETVSNIRHHPLIPADVRVHGFIINPSTGKLDKIPI
ncbi:MAG: carbonic anhydrase [Elusimicrobia bacterium]|nr:carbonic anhydrase [Elusimicrobiota bacterium]